ncbi:MAG TPA: type II toxin-antitoxin system prevent-host-death family antitoxin [bacterium]|nr:type II toxin-antitoxin system prevent-host-death family antitoxin [bacterium]
MKAMNARDARAQLRALLDRVAAGEEVAILRRGKEVARMVPPARVRRRLPDLTAFRASLRVEGGPISRTIVASRRKERF